MKATWLLYLISLLGCLPTRPTYNSEYIQQTQMQAKAQELSKIMKTWVGSHKSKVILSWGAPNRYASDGNNGEIMIWETSKIVTFNDGTLFMQKRVRDYKEFYVDAVGVIYNYSFGRDVN